MTENKSLIAIGGLCKKSGSGRTFYLNHTDRTRAGTIYANIQYCLHQFQLIEIVYWIYNRVAEINVPKVS